MGIEGLIILDSAGRPIIQSNFHSKSSHPLLHIDAVNSALEANAASFNDADGSSSSKSSGRPGDIDPVLLIHSHDGSCCCHVQHGDVRILCPITGEDDPLIAFEFIRTFVDILKDYFGPRISAAVIQENFDIVYQLLEEILDSTGYPLTTSLNLLKEIVLPPSLFSKFFAAASSSPSSPHAGMGRGMGMGGVGGIGSMGGMGIGIGGGGGGGAFASPIPWRKAGLRYNNNEIYFDMVEELSAIINKAGVPVACNVWGRVDVNCKLSGMPDLSLTFSNSKVLQDCSFHPCVRLQRFADNRVLSFVPPDGRFVLFEYRYAPPTSVAGANGGRDNVPIPLVMKPKIELEENGGSLDLTLTSKLTTRPMENVRIELFLGKGAGGVKCVSSRAGLGGGHVAGAGNGDSSGSWGWDHKRRVLRWDIPSMPPSSTWTLRGSWTSSISPPRPAHAVEAFYTISSFTYSNLMVDQLKMGAGETYKPYKGVRGKGEGKVEWRW